MPDFTGGLEGDGWISLVMAGLGAWSLLQAYQGDPVRLLSWAPVVAGLIAAGIGIYDAVQIENLPACLSFPSQSPR